MKEIEKFATILYRNISDGVLITDSNVNIVSVNPAFTNVTGYSADEVIGKNPSLLKSGIHNKYFYREIWSSVGKKGYWDGEIWNRRKNGEIYNEWLKINVVKNSNGRITNFIGVFKDITETEKIKNDMILTGAIQKKLLPQDIDNNHLTTHTLFKPKRYVSGDSFDFIWTDDKKLSGYLIDFMGHGLATALQTSTIRVLYHQIFTEKISLCEKVKRFNEQLLNYTSEDSFAAGFFFELDFTKKQLTYSAAGINYFITANPEETKTIKVPGPFLGMYSNVIYEHEVMSIESNDEFYFISDGITDMLDSNFTFHGKEFSERVSYFHSLTNSNKCKDDASAIIVKIK